MDEFITCKLLLSSEQTVDYRPNPVNYRPQIPRLTFRRRQQFIDRGVDGPAISVAQHFHEACAELCSGKLDATDQRRRHDIAGDANNKQVAQALIEDDLYRDSRIGAAENNSKRLLPGCQL